MKDLKITKTDIDLSDDYLNNPIVYELNMPVLRTFKTLSVTKRQEFEQKLEELGAEPSFSLLASKEDVEDYRKICNWTPEFESYKGPEGEEKFYSEVLGCLSNMIYKDLLIKENGEYGLKCTTGEIVVPPLFDNCYGSNDMLFCDTLAVVEKDGKQWLTRRDGSGRIISEGYDKISRSYCFGWVENEGKKGLLDSRTGKVYVPCEMDWMSGESGGNWFIGKNNKIGFVLSGYGVRDTTYIEPVYEMVDLATGLVYKEGKWGWVIADGSFIDEDSHLLFRQDPFINVSDYYHFEDYQNEIMVEEFQKLYSSTIKGLGFIGTLHLFGNPIARLDLPQFKLLPGYRKTINSRIVSIFRKQHKHIRRKNEVTFEIENAGRVFSVMVSKNRKKKGRKLLKVDISWELKDEIKIAIDETSPMVYLLCHRRLCLKDNKPMMKYCKTIECNDFRIPIVFISSLISFRSKCDELVVKCKDETNNLMESEGEKSLNSAKDESKL